MEKNQDQILAQRIMDLLNESGQKDKIAADFNRARELMACYSCALLEVETKFRVLNEQFSIQSARNPIESIRTRIKSPESIREKIQRKGMSMSFKALTEQMNDIAGIRVICSFVDDIYMLADCLLAQDDVRLVKRTDYIQNPKENGYRSLHLVVEVPIFLQNEKRYMRVEVQLRTIAMEFWANLEHKLRYKKNLPEQTAREVADELLTCAATCADLDARMLAVRKAIEDSREE